MAGIYAFSFPPPNRHTMRHAIERQVEPLGFSPRRADDSLYCQ